MESPATKVKTEWIRPSADKTHLVREGSSERFIVWGVNYDHDEPGRLLEDYWADEWDKVIEDFREIKALGANVVRIHLQVGRFMKDAEQPDKENLERFANLLKLSADVGLYLDVTGLACYHKQEVPAWYSSLDEADRWEVQARFWKAVASVGKGNPVIFCYDLMNEPIVSGGASPEDWLPGEPLGGKHFVQRITTNARGRDDKEIAKAWVAKLAASIRSVDDGHMITVGVIPWAQTFKGAKPLFYAPEVCGPLDLICVHFYPRKEKLEDDLEALRVYDVGKPMVIEEIFPMSASYEETEIFIEKSRECVDGWISFYWGTTIEEYDRKDDLGSKLVSGWLQRFRAMSPELARQKNR